MQHLDEGTIHAWLDGALAPDEAQRVEAHATTCDTCSALVAEARGLIAASSRILTSLDDVPVGVIPVRQGERTVAGDDLAAIRARKAVAELNRRRRWWAQRRVLAAAAIVFVAAGMMTVWRQGAFSKAANVALERASDAAAPPAAPPAPAPSANPSESGPAVASRSDAPRGAIGGGAAGSRDGRRQKETLAESRPRDLAAGAPSSATPGRDASAEVDRLQRSAQLAKLDVAKQAAPPVQQANVQAPAPALTQQQAITPPQQELRRQVLTDQATSERTRNSADSAQRANLQGVVTTGASARAEASVAKALAPSLLAGCYEITLGSAGATTLIPEAIALDTVVAAQRGDSVWYRARALSVQPPEVELTWRLGSPADQGRPVVEIAARRGRVTETHRVTLERDLALRAAEKRELAPSAAVVTARQTSCPRR